MRPLDRVGSVKLKFGLVIVAAVVVTLVVHELGNRVGLDRTTGAVMAAVIALVMVQLLARGMTSPLREMAAAARAMARGEHHHVITASSRDEVGDLARAFNHMAAELAEIDRVRRDLVANVSHELRTPISSLQAVLENVVDGVAEPDHETLRSMLTQVERLGRMVSQLLDLSRLESGNVPIEREPFAVGDVLDDVAGLARLHTHTAVEVDCPRPSPLAVGDAERVHQVVANLVENAVRHSPADEPVVVRASALDGKVVVEVADRGPGIDPADAHRVFERFYRSDAARAASDGGAGLGLAIARWIVDLHGGSIAVHPNDPTGCRVVVELPAGDAPR